MQKRLKYLTIALIPYLDLCVLKRSLLYIVVAFCLLIAARASAAGVEHLNTGQIVVTDQSTMSQKRAGKKAFQQVVVKLSGDPLSLENTQIKKAATNFEQYLVSSTFIQQDSKLIYQAEFNQDKIIVLLRAESLNVWGKRRPSGLFWLVIEDDVSKSKTLITQSNASALLELINQTAYQRGVDVVMPIGDLTDSINVTPLDVWGLFSASIYNKSARYNTNYVVGARVGIVFDDFTASEKLQLSYFITNGQTLYTAEITGDDINSLVATFVNEYASYLASLYSVDANDSGEIFKITLNVSNITSLLEYRKVLDILRSLTVTQNVELQTQTKDIATFVLTSNVPVDRLKTILQLEQKLREPEYQNTNNALAIDYQWRVN